MDDIKKTILITGVAGFIGSSLAKKILEFKWKVIGIDNINDYYDKKLKYDRLKHITNSFVDNVNSNWHFEEISLEDKVSIDLIFKKYKPEIVVNLAAQAGVRYSIENPSSYINSNLVGFANILEGCRNYNIEHLIYASSSSVYGGNRNLPFSEDQQVNHPISLSAATKKSNELMAHSYSSIFNFPATALRFFTVYGPWGRPDMAPMIFAKSIINRQPIDVFNFGKMERDFTYIDDIVEGIFKCCMKPATVDNNFDRENPNPSTSFAPHRVLNIGNSRPIKLLKFIEVLEDYIGIKAIKNFKEIQPGDVISTAADISKLESWINFTPKTSLEDGLNLFVKWYRDYYL